MPRLLITGCSSGFGLATARLFASRGWDVVATARRPGARLRASPDRLRILALDVTDGASIADAVAASGPVDALVNNAGIGFLNALEGTPMETARSLFETNTLGAIAMTRAVVPQMRARRAGTIVNVSSSATYWPEPLLSVYTATKAALNALSHSVALELAPFGVRVRVVVPGRAPTTGFNDNARALMTAGFPEPYADLLRRIFAGWEKAGGPVTTAEDVAEAVWLAATDGGAAAHTPAGPDAVALSNLLQGGVRR